MEATDSCEHGNEPSGFIKRGEFPDQRSYYMFFEENSVGIDNIHAALFQ
jgi:hypothetical protein